MSWRTVCAATWVLAGVVAGPAAAHTVASEPAASEALAEPLSPAPSSAESVEAPDVPAARPSAEAASAVPAEPAAPGTVAPPAVEPEPAPAPKVRLRSRQDPYERFNRSVYAFNDRIDRWVLKPAAEGYRRHVPEPLRSGVGNFFGNISDVWSAVNHLLQGKVVQSAQMTLRVATNTVFGLGGLLDPATEFGLERQSEDFGQTLGVWGLPSGPYLVLPVFGPSTVRDAFALPIDKTVVSTSLLVDGTKAQASITSLQLVSVRADLLGASRLLADVALDPYSFLRDAYLARRRSQVWDGDPPDEPDEAR